MGDQLATVVNTASLVKQHPFPMFINTIVVRLADAFKEGSNELRMCVARVLAECGSHLSLVFSGREILKRLLSVSHSNDPEARALTLQYITAIRLHNIFYVCIIGGNHCVKVIASVAVAEEIECAIFFCNRKADFSATVISQLAEMLISTETSFERKLLLVPVFGGMKATVATTKEVFGLSSRLLETFTQNDLISQLLCAMTALAEATRYTIPEQLTVLIGVFSRSIENVSLSNVALKNIEKLAKHSHIWTDEHLKRFCRNLGTYVRVTNFVFVYDISTSAAMFTVVFLVKLTVTGYSMLSVVLQHKKCRELYRTMGRFMCCGSVPDDTVLALLSPILSLPPTHTNMPQFIELFCLITDRLPFTVRILHNWAVQVVAENFISHYFLKNQLKYNQDNLRSSLLSFLLLAPTIELPNTICTVINGTDFDKYKVARIAFRNGHWASTAKPNLDAINTKSLAWGSVFIDSFAFPRGLINCLLLSAIAGQQILRTLSSFLHMTQQFSLRGTHTRIKNAYSTLWNSISVPIPDVSVSTTSSQQMRTLLSWANVQMTQLLRCENITEQLSISPGSQKENEITVSAVQPVPIQVDGVISTTHKTPVDSLIILAKVHFGTTPASCHIDFSVEFIDGEKMKKWNSGATAILKVIVKE
uniref:Integrator complex subunit 7 n=1 Tax=Heterorhabditis bacteriophora TaxID=37862 RepID=A0A1I7WRV0_HETBA